MMRHSRTAWHAALKGCATLAIFLAPVLPAGQEAPAVAAGAALFQRSCASCHNVEGRAPSLSTGVFAHGGEDAQIAQTIRAGGPGTQMPPFPALSDQAVRHPIAYVRRLPAPPSREEHD